MMATQETLRRLALIRYVLRLGVTQSREPEPLAGLAVLMFHDAIELFLHLASEVLNASPTGNELMQYFDPINAKLAAGELSQRESVRRLNRARVSLKHAGTLPSRVDLEAFRATAAAFFTENTPLLFGVELESASLTSLITAPAPREALQQAEQEMASEKPKEALVSISLAFALELADRGIVDEAATGGHLFSRDEDDRDLTNQVNQLRDLTQELRVDVALLHAGIDTARYEAFRAIAPRTWVGNRENPTYFGGKHDATPEQVRFCYDFVLETILDLQERDAAVAAATTHERRSRRFRGRL